MGGRIRVDLRSSRARTPSRPKQPPVLCGVTPPASLGCCAHGDPTYKRTRAFVLSEDNPYFFRGRAGEGVGGPHVGLGMIWPLGVIMRGLTSDDEREIAMCLRLLKTTHAGTGFMHESFFKDDPKRFTRSWFAWANTLFGELVLQVYAARPHLLRAS